MLNIKSHLLSRIFVLACITLSEIILSNSLPDLNYAFAAELSAMESVSQEKPEYGISRWIDQIDMHWGGRLKSIGSAIFARDDTIYEPVGTGTYLDLYTNLRINNETFFSDWGTFEAQYEAFLEGGKAWEKKQELNEIFPNFILLSDLPMVAGSN